MAGYDPVPVAQRRTGGIDLESLRSALCDDVAGFMITNPNTLGLFDAQIIEIAELVHEAGGLLYYDGANLNAILGISRPGDMGFDIMHFNPHKTFATPHGGGGPAPGPSGSAMHWRRSCPCHWSRRRRTAGSTWTTTVPSPSARSRTFYGNIGVLVRAYTYIRALGGEGLTKASETRCSTPTTCWQECATSSLCPTSDAACTSSWPRRRRLTEHGVRAMDIAKRLLDYGFHAPTVYFPLIVHEALMIEPTETESREELDAFVTAARAIVGEARTQPDKLRNAPLSMPVRRLDEAEAARRPVLTQRFSGDEVDSSHQQRCCGPDKDCDGRKRQGPNPG